MGSNAVAAETSMAREMMSIGFMDKVGDCI